jgi:hypothetical protein
MAGLPTLPSDVQAVYGACSPPVRQGLHHLRALILAQAARMPQIGPMVEGLRWGQPAFLTLQTGAVAACGSARANRMDLACLCIANPG